MERKFGIISSYLKDVKEADALKYMKAAGFDCFFTGAFEKPDVYALKNEAERLGLEFEFVHSPFWYKGIHVNEFWSPALNYLPLYNAVIRSIDSAAEAGVKTVVMHVSGGWIAPHITDIGLSHFDRVVEYAIGKGVRVAFENIRNLGNLAAIMERYYNIPEVGFCYDCGHEHCYTETVPFLDIFGKRTFCTHLHDNFGLDKEDPKKNADYHLLPFDGDIDYSVMMKKLDKYNYQGSLMLECEQGGKEQYKDLAPEEFSALIFERAERIANSRNFLKN